MRSALTGDNSQYYNKYRFHFLARPTSLFHSNCSTARLLSRAARANKFSRPAKGGAGNPAIRGGGENYEEIYASPANKTFEPTRSGKKSHAEDLSSVLKFIPRKRNLSNQYGSNTRLPHWGSVLGDGKVSFVASKGRLHGTRRQPPNSVSPPTTKFKSR